MSNTSEVVNNPSAVKDERKKRTRNRTKPKNNGQTIIPDQTRIDLTRAPNDDHNFADSTKGGRREARTESHPMRKPLNFAPPASFTTATSSSNHLVEGKMTKQSRRSLKGRTEQSAESKNGDHVIGGMSREGKVKVDTNDGLNGRKVPRTGNVGSQTRFAQTVDPFPDVNDSLIASIGNLSLEPKQRPAARLEKDSRPPRIKKAKAEGAGDWRVEAASLQVGQPTSREPREPPAVRGRESRKRPERGQFPVSIFQDRIVTRGAHGRFEFKPVSKNDAEMSVAEDATGREKQRDQYSGGPGVVAQNFINREADVALLQYQRSQSLNFAPPETQEPIKQTQPDAEKATSVKDTKIAKTRKERAAFYEEHVTRDEALAGLKEGLYLKGILRINQKARQDAWVSVKSDRVVQGDALLEGDKSRNRALNGDEVVIELLGSTTDEKTNTDESHGRAQGDQKHLGRTRAKVVHVLSQRPIQRISGFIRPPGYVYGQKKQDHRALIANVNHQTSCAFHPLDQRVPWLTISQYDLPAELQGPNWIFNILQKQKTLFAARIVTWQAQSRTPRGKIVEELGSVGNINAETAAILADCDVDVRDHSTAALACLPDTPWHISEEEISKRRDFRRDRVCTIDPETARDLDDALSVRELDDGNYEIGVHIADVSHFIQQDNELDKVARARATTVYMVQKAIPMLPRLLCEELCSLNPAVDRLAFSVTWTLNPDGEEVGPRWYGRSVIRSAVRFAYGEAQNLLDGKSWAEGVGKAVDGGHTEEQITKDVKVLLRMSKAMRARRFENGALTINAMKLNFKLNKDGLPGVAEVYQLKDANRLIEEFMLKANISVAEKIVDAFPEHALLRHHPAPKDQPLQEFVKYAEKLGVHIDSSSSASLQEGFNALAELARDNPVVTVLQQNAVKSMQKALYMCTGLHENREDWLHYALAVPLYTHFTSPIRRYADVIVHRLLDRALKQAEPGFEADDCEEWAKNCNVRKENARLAQDRSSMLYLCAFIEEHCKENDLVGLDAGMVMEAIVISVKDRSLDVIVPSMGLEQRIYYANPYSIESFEHNENNESVEICWRTRSARLAAIKAAEAEEAEVANMQVPESKADESDREQIPSTGDNADSSAPIEAGSTMDATVVPRKTRIAVLDKVKVWLRGDFDVSPCQVVAGFVIPEV